MIFTTHGQLPVTLFNSASTRGGWINPEEIAAFLAACEIFLTNDRPDVVWTYGGDPVSLAVQQLVKRLDIPILFALHNFAYLDPEAFRLADYAIVPDRVLPTALLEGARPGEPEAPAGGRSGRVEVAARGQRSEVGSQVPAPISDLRPLTSEYVTFVNPEPRKGLFIFARIANEVCAAATGDSAVSRRGSLAGNNRHGSRAVAERDDPA